MKTPFDIVIPQGNESKFIEMALRIKTKELVFLTKDISYSFPKDLMLKFSKKIKIRTACLLSNPSDLKKARNRFDLVFVPAERKFFEIKADFVINTELSEKRDSFHYRKTNLNQVHAKLCRDNSIIVALSFNNLLENPLLYFGRMKQNVRVLRKYNVNYAAYSFASDPKDMTTRDVLDALSRILEKK